MSGIILCAENTAAATSRNVNLTDSGQGSANTTGLYTETGVPVYTPNKGNLTSGLDTISVMKSFNVFPVNLFQQAAGVSIAEDAMEVCFYAFYPVFFMFCK